MNVYITYDAHNGRSDIKPALIDAGFMDSFKDADGTIYYLPNTSLWYESIISTSEAERFFFKAIEQLNRSRNPLDKIRIDRFIAVETDTWSGIEGKRHA